MGTDIWVLSASRSDLGEIDKLLSRYPISPRWFIQPASPANFQFRSSADLTALQAAQLAAELSRLCAAFEIAQFAEEGSLYLYVKHLGLKRLAIDASGEVTLRVGQIEAILSESGGNIGEFNRLIREATGTLWLDTLEPLRQGRPRIERLLRAI